MPEERCSVCDVPGPRLCFRCQTSPHFRRILAAAPYGGVLAEAVKALKYRSVASLAGPLGDLAATRLSPAAKRLDALVPVPLSSPRMRQRGFNQAALLAARLAGAWGVPVLDGLVRTRHTEPQVKLDAASRLRNLNDVFCWRGPDLSGLRIGVVDDVATTGATIMAASQKLYEARAARVVGLVIAREA